MKNLKSFEKFNEHLDCDCEDCECEDNIGNEFHDQMDDDGIKTDSEYTHHVDGFNEFEDDEDDETIEEPSEYEYESKRWRMNEKKNPNAAIRNRGDVVFPAGSKNVKDDKDHFPVNSIEQARNALARAGQYKSAPSWYDGSLAELKSKIKSKVSRKYPSIKVSK